jgi:hypothetical protein
MSFGAVGTRATAPTKDAGLYIAGPKQLTRSHEVAELPRCPGCGDRPEAYSLRFSGGLEVCRRRALTAAIAVRGALCRRYREGADRCVRQRVFYR